MTTKPKNCFTHEVRKFPMLLCLFPLICKKLIDSLISSIHGKIKKKKHEKDLGCESVETKRCITVSITGKVIVENKSNIKIY